jgi:cytochrome c oxidase subunit 3
MGLFKTLRTKPWLTTQTPDAGYAGDGASPFPTQRIGLIGFIGVASVLFTLFCIAYRMRMIMSNDWVALAEPKILWMNTGLLILASIALQMSWAASRKDQFDAARRALVVAGIVTGGFLIGQYLAWSEMAANGFFAPANPSYAFFYLLTGVHGAHILGGLVAWVKASGRLFGPADTPEQRAQTKLGIELCAIYWHFLLGVWVLLFALMLST